MPGIIVTIISLDGVKQKKRATLWSLKQYTQIYKIYIQIFYHYYRSMSLATLVSILLTSGSISPSQANRSA